MKAFLKEAVARWKAETPIFFRRIIIGGIGIGGLGGSLKVAAQLPDVHLPTFISAHIGHMITAGVIAAAVAKFAKIDISQSGSSDQTPKV